MTVLEYICPSCRFGCLAFNGAGCTGRRLQICRLGICCPQGKTMLYNQQACAWQGKSWPAMVHMSCERCHCARPCNSQPALGTCIDRHFHQQALCPGPSSCVERLASDMVAAHQCDPSWQSKGWLNGLVWSRTSKSAGMLRLLSHLCPCCACRGS